MQMQHDLRPNVHALLTIQPFAKSVECETGRENIIQINLSLLLIYSI